MAVKSLLSFSQIVVLAFFTVNHSFGQDHMHLLCGIHDYDYFNLTAATWYVTLNESYCLHSVNDSQTPPKCDILIAFCRKFSVSGPCQNSSVCHRSQMNVLDLGGYRENPFEEFDLPDSSDGFLAVFPNGSEYTMANHSSCNLHTSIEFLCEPSSHWVVTEFSEIEKKAPEPKSVFYDDKSCEMKLTFNYAGACKTQLSSVENMSAGTMLIVIFLVSIIIYFVFGSLINIARGHTGSQVIPHNTFWEMLPIYIFDGCQFVFCCGRQPVTPAYESI